MFETLQNVGVISQIRSNNLDRHQSVQFAVAGFVDGPHAALPEHMQDLVTLPQQASRLKRGSQGLSSSWSQGRRPSRPYTSCRDIILDLWGGRRDRWFSSGRRRPRDRSVHCHFTLAGKRQGGIAPGATTCAGWIGSMTQGAFHQWLEAPLFFRPTTLVLPRITLQPMRALRLGCRHLNFRTEGKPRRLPTWA